MDLASRPVGVGCWRHGCLEMDSREVSTLVCCKSPGLRGERGYSLHGRVKSPRHLFLLWDTGALDGLWRLLVVLTSERGVVGGF